MGAAIAAIIAAVIAAGVTIGTTVATNNDIEAANEEGRKLAEVNRQDSLKQQERNNRFTSMGLDMQKKQLGFQMGEATRNREERSEERNYNRRQQSIANILGVVNQDQVARDSLLNIWPNLVNRS